MVRKGVKKKLTHVFRTLGTWQGREQYGTAKKKKSAISNSQTVIGRPSLYTIQPRQISRESEPWSCLYRHSWTTKRHNQHMCKPCGQGREVSKRYVENVFKNVRQDARHAFGSLKRKGALGLGRTHVGSRTMGRDVSRVRIKSSC